MKTPKNINKGAYLSASATLEGALVIPLFVYGIVAVAYLLQIMLVRVQVNESLYHCSRKCAVYVYVYNEIKEKGIAEFPLEQGEDVLEYGLTLAAVRQMMIDELGEHFAADHYVVGGNAGWNFTGTELLKDGSSTIDLKLSYTIKNPFDIFGLSQIRVSERKKINAWLGETANSFTDMYTDDEDEEYVYITADGEVYHTQRTCTYLLRVIRHIDKSKADTLRSRSGGKYYPCSVCKQKEASVIYYTDYGNRYHASGDCSVLKRNILTVRKSSVRDRKLCDKCGKGEYEK